MKLHRSDRFLWKASAAASATSIVLRLVLSVAFLALAASKHEADDESGRLRLRDGRVLAYSEFDDPSGTPVLYLHDEYCGVGCPSEMHELAAALGLRFVLPERPYFGRSDPYPEAADPRRQFSENAIEVLEELEIDRFTIFSRRTGLRFGVTNGHQAYVHEMNYDAAECFDELLSCPVRIHCLIGADDPNDRLNRAATLSARGAPLDVTVIPEAGQLFFYSHAKEIVDHIAMAAPADAD